MGKLTMRSLFKNILIGNVSFFFILIFISCTTMSLDTFHEPKKPTYKEKSEAPGLMMYIKPMLNDAETKKYFGVKLLNKNILAVYISAWNANPSKNYIFTEDSIKVTQILNIGEINQPEKGSEDAASIAAGVGVGTVSASAMVAAATFPAFIASGALLAIPIAQYGIPLYISKKSSNASVIRENFESQRFRATTLEPGERECGFLYFNWDNLKEYNEVSLCFLMTGAVSNEMYNPCFDVPLQKGVED